MHICRDSKQQSPGTDGVAEIGCVGMTPEVAGRRQCADHAKN
jgi:hypothetical protein